MRDERADRTVTVSTERTYTTLDKSTWGPGLWQSEPDKVQFVDPATKLPCLAVRGYSGSWCGYVGIAEDHPLFGIAYSEPLPGTVQHERDSYYDQTPGGMLDVHGGITYSDSCQEGGDESSSVCHIPAPGETDHVWWFGFDTGHSGDYCPKMDFRAAFANGEYRTLGYIREQCAELAAQLHAIGNGGEEGR